MSKVTRFPTQEPEVAPPEPARFPDAPTVESMLMGKPLESILIITVNTEGSVSHYMDGVTVVEAIGLAEMIKQAMYLSDMGYNE